MKYLKDVHNENPVKNVRGSELINIFNIESDSLEATLRFLKDMGLIHIMSNDFGVGAIMRITEKGLREIEDLQG